MANSKTGNTVFATTGTFTGTINGENLLATDFIIGMDTFTKWLTIYIDDVDNPFNFLSLHIHSDLDGKFTETFTSRNLRFFYENQAALYRPVEDGKVHFDFNHAEQTYKGHFNNIVFGPFPDGEIGKTYNITGNFDLKGRVDPSKHKEKLDRNKNVLSSAL